MVFFIMPVLFCCFFILIMSYLIGGLNFSILISKFYFKKEIRVLGSGNAGTTNMLRIFGKKVAALTLIGDFLKGSFCVLMIDLIVPMFLKSNAEAGAFFTNFKIEFQMYALIGVVLGHIFPVFFKFKGGKGIATTAGAMVAVDYKIFTVSIIFFLIVLMISKIVSLSSILTSIFFAIFSAIYWYINLNCGTSHFNFFTAPFKVWFLITTKSTFLSFIIIIKHLKNIKRIIEKTEPKIGR